MNRVPFSRRAGGCNFNQRASFWTKKPYNEEIRILGELAGHTSAEMEMALLR
jgi:hypothetical protein